MQVDSVDKLGTLSQKKFSVVKCFFVSEEMVYIQGWSIALFGKEWFAHFFCKKEPKKSEKAFRSLSLFLKEQKSDLLFVAFFKRGKERFAHLRSFGKEWKSKLLFVALLEKTKRAICSLLLFLKEVILGA